MTNNPFIPVKFPSGPPTTEKGIYEDGPGPYANPVNSTNVVRYNGQDQVVAINVSYSKPPTCRLPGAAVGLSKIP